MTAHREPQTADGRVGDTGRATLGAAIDRHLRADFGVAPTVRRTRAEHGQRAGEHGLRRAAPAPAPEHGVVQRQPEPITPALNPERICRLELASVATAAPLAALHTVDVLTAWGCPHIAETAAVVVSELVTDTVRRAGRSADTLGDPHRCGTCRRPLDGPYADLRDTQRFVLTLAKTPTSLFVEIYDLDQTPPVAGEAGSPDEGGQALSLVAVVSRTWNCYRPTGGGKVVWAELTVPRPDPDTVGSPRTRTHPGMLRSAPVMDDHHTLRRVRDALMCLDEDKATGQQS
jgi:hypothetical protein